MFTELGRLIDQVSKDKGIDKKIVKEAVAQGLLSAARKKYGTYRDIEVKFSEETGELELFEFKTVVSDEDFEDDQIEIKISEAVKLDPEVQKNDQIGLRLDTEGLGRIDAQAAKQIIIQSIRSAEHAMIFNEFEKRKGEIVRGIVRRVERGAIVVDLEKTEAYIPRREQIHGEKYKPGDRIQGYILEVEALDRGPRIIMSRAHPDYLIKLFSVEVPEIYEGIVKIKKAAREAGQRAKIAVYSLDSAVHPVGACVGMKGSRVQNITQELKGERIDVIVWEDDPVQFVCNALAPAKLAKVFVDEETSTMEIIVPDDQLSLAIGKRGQNVRLAAQLTGWKLDIVSEQDYERKRTESLYNLCLLPDVTDTQAQSIFQAGVSHVLELQDLSVEKAQGIPGYESKEKAVQLIESAKKLVQEYKEQNKEFETPPTPEEEIQQKKILTAQSQADLRLKKEMEQLKASEGTKKESSEDKESSSEKKLETPSQVKAEGEEPALKTDSDPSSAPQTEEASLPEKNHTAEKPIEAQSQTEAQAPPQAQQPVQKDSSVNPTNTAPAADDNNTKSLEKTDRSKKAPSAGDED